MTSGLMTSDLNLLLPYFPRGVGIPLNYAIGSSGILLYWWVFLFLTALERQNLCTIKFSNFKGMIQ